MNTGQLVLAGLTAIVAVMLGSCSVNPATGSPDLVFIGESKEIEMGRELHEKILESTPIYQSKGLTTYVNEVGQKLAKVSHRPDLEYTFTIVDSPDINAFALPGGFIYINRGLLGYLQTEAQMAAVLAHEIAHVTARHSVRQDTARKGSGVLTVLSVFATGSTVVGDVTNLWSTAAVMGYGREMELEADSFGAEYLFRAGYNPKAMIEVIGVLKDHERFTRRLALESGKKRFVTYHGVFSTHPRNDTRLQEAVNKAGDLPDDAKGNDNEKIFRNKTEGMLYGINYNAKTAKAAEKNTFSHSKLGFSIDFPKGWETDNKRSQIVSSAPDKRAQLSIKVGLLKQPTAPDIYIRDTLKIDTLQQSEAFSQFGLIGHTGIKPAGDGERYPTRVAVILQGRKAYLLEGKTLLDTKLEKPDKDKTPAKTDDELIVDSIRSFRPSRTARRQTGTSKVLHYVKANEHTTFARLAQHINLGKYTEAQLRILNGYYPRGEPSPGEWIKIVK